MLESLLREHGPVLTSATPGLTNGTRSRAVRSGALVAVLPGVYVAAPLARDFNTLAAAVMAWDPNAVIIGAAAAKIGYWPELQVSVIEVATRARPTRPGFTFSRMVVPAEQVRHWQGKRFMAPAMAAVYLIERFDGEPIDRALRSKRITLDQLWEALAAAPGRVGNVKRNKVLIRSRTRPWSEAERLAHHEFDRFGLKGWVANVALRMAEGDDYYPDVMFKDVKLAVEIDGYEHHSGREVFEGDRVRQNRLVLAGWTVLRFTYRQLVDDPAGVVRQIRQMLTVLRRAA